MYARKARPLRMGNRQHSKEVLKKEFGGITMSSISKEQRKRDEETLAIFLVVLNLALLGMFLAVCFYQNS